MTVFEVLEELRKHGISVTPEAVNHRLRTKYHLKRNNIVYIFPDEIGQEIIQYYVLKNRGKLAKQRKE